jgi:hypothetical protein
MAVNRDIKYINRDFNDFRTTLVDFTKTYFPTTYNDFSPASPGMMLMEMASYVGDVLSFYLDNQIQENFLQFARQENNLYQLAYMFGYKPKTTGVATATIDFYQQVPAINVGGEYMPDFSYTLSIPSNATIQSATNTSVYFLVQDPIDFSVSSSTDPTEVSVYVVSGNTPQFFLLKKSRPAISATINTTTFSFGSPEKFKTINIESQNIIGILDIVDSDNNTWYEVDYLAQDAVYDSIRNSNTNNPSTYTDQDAPYILQLKSVQRRFVTRFLSNTNLQIQFGAGTTAVNDATLVPNPDNVGLGLPYGQSKLTTAFDPTNFIFTNTYGIAPSNTTLTIRYLTGGGVTANVPANSLTIINTSPTFNSIQNDTVTANAVFASLAVTNPSAASGGGDGDTIEELRQNTISNFSTQLRTVTTDDYLIRALSLPSQYGTIAKAYIEPTKAQNLEVGEIPSTLDLYILTYNSSGQLATTSNTLKTNLTTYLSQYRVIGDRVSIKDGYIINIGIDFEVISLPNYNSNDILLKCIQTLQSMFTISQWQINQPIILRDLYMALDKVQGVQSVKKVTVANKVGEAAGYSPYGYDLTGATLNGVIYPSLDPSIFEVKYPNTDITGKIVTL